ncbi:ankyrin [Wilcoxina mikolae CBS 423.85]|nr:ankyrin [Wilcoxina mikolae CBS 423.85]
MIQILLEWGVNINARAGWHKATPLHYACYWTRYDIPENKSDTIPAIRMLLEKGANIETKDSNGYTPLIDAINWKYVKAVETLLEYGADVNTTEQMGISALHIAAVSSVECAKLLVNHGADRDAYADYSVHGRSPYTA